VARSRPQPQSQKWDRPLPANPDAERLVLGSIMLDDSAFVTVSSILRPVDFSLDRHQRIFQRMIDLHDRGEHIDRITVCNELMTHRELESCGGLSYLVSLDDGLPRISNIDSYARIVKEKAILRGIIASANQTINLAFLEESSSKILTSAREQLIQLESGQLTSGPMSPAQIIDAAGGITQIIGPARRGLPTGLTRYDELTGGLHNAEVTVIAARPSMGKTALALTIACHAALTQKKTVVLFSLEMSREEVLQRLISMVARVDSRKMRADMLNSDERRRIAIAVAAIAESPIYIDDQSSATVGDIHAKIRRRLAEGPLDLALIDYLQLVSAGRTFENRVQEVTHISRTIKIMAMETRLPIVVLSQLSRAPELRKGNNRPQLSDLRESGSIEQDCDVCTFVFRPEVYQRDRLDLRGVAELIIAKQRNGPIGIVHTTFLHRYMVFENAASEPEPEDLNA
jgi:replicative DNA helicase